ncbi:hypothetical protein LIER_35688 [Lithospermum erythrorhizon]|uniref:Uncharacterized protein n=1 Tax=Lithospermum erythrorhizon TaxID=34254 RepID=A0AAV3NUU9_LITER
MDIVVVHGGDVVDVVDVHGGDVVDVVTEGNEWEMVARKRDALADDADATKWKMVFLGHDECWSTERIAAIEPREAKYAPVLSTVYCHTYGGDCFPQPGQKMEHIRGRQAREGGWDPLTSSVVLLEGGHGREGPKEMGRCEEG